MSAAPPSKPAYHHGDLRAALVNAAQEALETQPPEAITLKSLATRLGVSQPAPYRHFATREALLTEVAADGFERFASRLMIAARDGPEAGALERSCLAYVEFGRENLGVYRLMFASNLLSRAEQGTPLADVAAKSFDLLLDGVTHYVPQARAYPVALAVWAALHGMVMLDAEGLFANPMRPEIDAASIVREVVARVRD